MKVAVNDFVKRQTELSGKTFSNDLSFGFFANHAKDKMIKNAYFVHKIEAATASFSHSVQWHIMAHQVGVSDRLAGISSKQKTVEPSYCN